MIIIILIFKNHMKFKSVEMVTSQTIIDMDSTGMDAEEIKNYFINKDFIIRGASIKRGEDGRLHFSCLLIFPRHKGIEEGIADIEKIGKFKSIDILTVQYICMAGHRSYDGFAGFGKQNDGKKSKVYCDVLFAV